MGTHCCGSEENKNHNTKKNVNINTNTSSSYSPYALSNAKPIQQNIYNNNYINDKELIKMKNHYFNLLTVMGVGKKTIGQGGQAKIRKYYSPKFKKMVVEKVIISNKSSNSDSVIFKDFLDKINLLKEAILLSECDHPNVVKIYDFIENPVTIVMEYFNM